MSWNALLPTLRLAPTTYTQSVCMEATRSTVHWGWMWGISPGAPSVKSTKYVHIFVVYSASNNELVLTKILVKNCVMLIDSTPTDRGVSPTVHCSWVTRRGPRWLLRRWLCAGGQGTGVLSEENQGPERQINKKQKNCWDPYQTPNDEASLKGRSQLRQILRNEAFIYSGLEMSPSLQLHRAQGLRSSQRCFEIQKKQHLPMR